MTVSLKDVARAAGKSPGTVSQVLNDHRANVRISDETRRMIREAADRLGYRPNPIARSLRTRRTQTIGVLINALGPNPRQFDMIERIAVRSGFQLLMSVSRNDLDHEEHAIKHLVRRQIDGLLVILPAIRAGHRKTLERLVADRFPVVGIGLLPVAGGSYVDWDRVGAYRALGLHLLSCGCRRIGFVGYGMTPGIRGRLEGLRAALGGSPQAELEVFGCDAQSESLGVEALAGRLRPALESRRIDAVVTQNDTLALAAMQVARSLGLSVPRDLAVAGCSNYEFGRMLDVPLTTTSLPDVQLAERAMDNLIDRIERPHQAHPPLAETIPAELLVRRSSLFGTAG